MSFVYVLRSKTSGRFYVGQTRDVQQRLGQHNLGITRSTRNRGPWELVYQESYATRGEAMSREHFLKSGQGREQLKTRLEQRERSAVG